MKMKDKDKSLLLLKHGNLMLRYQVLSKMKRIENKIRNSKKGGFE